MKTINLTDNELNFLIELLNKTTVDVGCPSYPLTVKNKHKINILRKLE